MRFKGAIGALVAGLALVALVPAATATSQSRASGKRGCSNTAHYISKVYLIKGKPTSLASDWVQGPGQVSVSKGRSATSSTSVTQTSGVGGGGGVDLVVVKSEVNSSLSESHEVGKSVTKTLDETITYKIPRHKTGRIRVFRAKAFIHVKRYFLDPKCRPYKVKRWLVKMPLKHSHFLFKRQLVKNS